MAAAACTLDVPARLGDARHLDAACRLLELGLSALFGRVVRNEHEMLRSKAIIDMLNSYVLKSAFSARRCRRRRHAAPAAAPAALVTTMTRPTSHSGSMRVAHACTALRVL